MTLTETKVIDRIEVVGEYANLQVREATIIMRDGEQIAKSYHRWAFPPGSDVSFMPSNVQAMAQTAWTPEVIAAYQAQMAAQQAKMGA
jgi:hypothetical protein